MINKINNNLYNCHFLCVDVELFYFIAGKYLQTNIPTYKRHKSFFNHKYFVANSDIRNISIDQAWWHYGKFKDSDLIIDKKRYEVINLEKVRYLRYLVKLIKRQLKNLN